MLLLWHPLAGANISDDECIGAFLLKATYYFILALLAKFRITNVQKLTFTASTFVE
jgi:hypothetical protein